MFHSTKHVTGGILWANLHLLFWLSLFPFTTAWVGENHLAPTPTAVYGFVLLMAAIAYFILQRAIIISARQRLPARGGDREGLERQTLACALSRRHPARVRERVDFRRPVHLRRPDVARARPPHRARAGEAGRKISHCRQSVRSLVVRFTFNKSGVNWGKG